MGAGSFGRKLLVLEGSEDPYAGAGLGMSVTTDVGGWDTGSGIVCPSGGWYLVVAELLAYPHDGFDSDVNPWDGFVFSVSLPDPWAGKLNTPLFGGVASGGSVGWVIGPYSAQWRGSALAELTAGDAVTAGLGTGEVALPGTIDHLNVYAKCTLSKVR